jgi:hypothetical protein
LRRLFAALLCCGALFLPSAAFADDEPRVVAVLVSPTGDERLAARVSAELRAMGLEPKTVVVDDAAAVTTLESRAKDSGAIAAIRVIRSDQRAEVWVADRVTGKTLLRNVTCAPGEDAVSVLAVRAVELLRASLLEIEAVPPPRTEIPVTEVVRKVVATAHPQTPPPFAMGIGFGPQLVPTLSAAFDLVVSIAWMPTSRLGVEVFGVVPLVSSKVCDTAGCANVAVGLVGGGVRWLLTTWDSRVQPVLGLGFAGAIAHADGHAVAPYVDAHADIAAASAYARASVYFAATTRFRIGLDVLAGAALPPIPIRFAGAQVGEWGAPYVTTAVRAEFSFP